MGELAGKKLFFGIAIIIVLLVIAGLAYYLLFMQPFQTKTAELIINQGSVQVLRNAEWQNAINGMQLLESDSVKTLAGSKASIILFESSIVRLNENTEVKLSELFNAGDLKNNTVGIAQEAGRTWSKVLKLSGIKEFTVETPTTTATVRGTAFDFWIQGNKIIVGVSEGTVSIKVQSQEQLVEAGKQAVIAEQVISIEDLVVDDWILENQQADIALKEVVKRKIKEKYAAIIAVGKQMYGVSDSEVDALIEEAINRNYGTEDLEKFLQDQNIEIPSNTLG